MGGFSLDLDLAIEIRGYLSIQVFSERISISKAEDEVLALSGVSIEIRRERL